MPPKKVAVKKETTTVVTSTTTIVDKPAGRKRAATTSANVTKKLKLEGTEGVQEDVELKDEEPAPLKQENKQEKDEEEHQCDSHDEGASSAEETEDETSSKPKKKTAAKKKAPAKPKAKKGAEMVPLRIRTPNLRVFLGAHISSAGGPQNAVDNSLRIGGNAFALFLKSQRKWTSKELAKDDIDAFKKKAKEVGYDTIKHCLPHGSYLVNLAQNDAAKATQAYDCFLDDLKRCEQLGIGLYNFHPGSTLGLPRDEAIGRISIMLNRAHKETKFVKTVLENMAGQGNVIGSKLEDLRDIIAGVEDKSRMGVCVDTCHTFAAGFDIRTQDTSDAFWKSFDEIVGMKYLCALHINDSKAPLGSNLDRHENIGIGFLGLEAFRLIVNKEELQDLPLILETPMKEDKTWADEVALLESLIGKGPDDPEFLEKAKKLAAKGKADRDKAMEAWKKKVEKEEKSKERAGKKAGKQTTLTAMVKAKTTVKTEKKVVKRKKKVASDEEESDLSASE